MDDLDRRQFLKLGGAGVAGAVYVSGLWPQRVFGASTGVEDFGFVQLSDTHWGFGDPSVNPDFAGTLEKAVASVNGLRRRPDFVVFTGDLTHTTDDGDERRRRLARFREIVGALQVKSVRFMPGEHDASLDRGAAFTEFFGDTHYVFDHKGVHFVVLDNVSDPTGSLGDAQLAWLRDDLATRDKAQPIIVLTHRPLFDLAPQWDWATRDGAQALEALVPFEYVTVFYGHIHQEHHHTTGHIAHHSAKSLIFPLPAPMSVPKKAPIPWNPARPYDGLGFRSVQTTHHAEDTTLVEWPVAKVSR